MISDRELVEQFDHGNMDAYKNIVDRFSQRIFNLIQVVVEEPEQAREVLKNTFYRVYLGLYKYKGSPSFHVWLSKIAVIQIFTKIKGSPAPWGIQESSYRSLSDMDAGYRLLLHLRYVENLSLEEISEILVLTEQEISQLLETARTKLVDYYQRIGENYGD